MPDSKTEQSKKSWIPILSTCGALLFALLITWFISYRSNITLLTQTDIQLKQQQSQGEASTWMQQLNILAESEKHLGHGFFKFARLFGFGQAYDQEQQLNLRYQTLLQTEFLPYIEGILTHTITKNINHNKLAAYNALKIYLMLTDKTHYDQSTIMRWFKDHWKQSEKSDLLTIHLAQLLKLNNLNWPIDRPLIQKTQQTLQQLPKADIAFLELQGLYQNQQEPLILNTEGSNLDLAEANIPALYSQDHFKDIYNEQIPNIIETLDKTDWVLGQSLLQPITTPQKANLISNLRALYLQYFSLAWQTVLPKIKLEPPKNFDDVQTLIHTLNDPQSPMMRLLNIVVGNATLANDQAIDSDIVAYATQQGATYTKIQTSLNTLSLELNHITASADVSQSSYNITAGYFNNIAQPNPIKQLLSLSSQMPSPIGNWLNTIATQAWTILLDNACNHLNNIWSSTVLPSYASQLQDHYPLFPNSTTDTSLAGFSSFFAPGGAIDTYFNYYLKPFVDMSQHYWSWQTLYGKSINIHQKTLDMLMRASLIQQMFFVDDPSRPSFKFTLKPLSLSPNTSAFNLDIDGQSLHFMPNKSTTGQLTWPGPDPGHVTLGFTTGDRTNTKTFYGPWALFKFIQSETLTPTNNPQNYILKIKLGDTLAIYELSTDKRINPFLPGVLTSFRAENTLK